MTLVLKCDVPRCLSFLGQVHLDLIQAGLLEEDVYYGTNYVK